MIRKKINFMKYFAIFFFGLNSSCSFAENYGAENKISKDNSVWRESKHICSWYRIETEHMNGYSRPSIFKYVKYLKNDAYECDASDSEISNAAIVDTHIDTLTLQGIFNYFESINSSSNENRLKILDSTGIIEEVIDKTRYEDIEFVIFAINYQGEREFHSRNYDIWAKAKDRKDIAFKFHIKIDSALKVEIISSQYIIAD